LAVGSWQLAVVSWQLAVGSGQWSVVSGQWSDSGIHHFAVHHFAKDLSAINFSAKGELELLRNSRLRGSLPFFHPCPGFAIRAILSSTSVLRSFV
jgi:hypothetical protein